MCAATVVLLAFAAAPAFGQSDESKPPSAPEVDLDEMVKHPSATFDMGVPYQEISRYGDSWFVDQQPEFSVRLDAFYLDRHEVTVREFALFLTYAAGEHYYDEGQPIDRVGEGFLPAEGKAEEPVRYVTWRAARDFCAWAGKRLPTEAEWEFAATGTEGRTYPWGDEGPDCDRAVHFTGRTFCQDGPQPVGQRNSGATPKGVHDLGGNVAEWVADWYGPYPETDETLDNPTGSDSGTYRVVRGGGFLDSGQFLRTPARRAAPPKGDARDVGFRCAVGVDGAEDDDGRARGSLELPPEKNRQTVERFPAPESGGPETLARGYSNPGSVVRFGDNIYFVAGDGTTIVELAPMTGEAREIVSDASGIADLAAGENRLYVTDGESGEVRQIVPGMPPTTVAEAESEPGPIAARGTDVVWGETNRVVAYDESSEETTVLVEDIQNAVAVSLSESHAYFAVDGDGNYDDMRVAIVPLSGGSASTLFEAPDWRGDFWVPSVEYDSGSEKSYFLLRRSGFPRHGFLYTAGETSDSTKQQTHTPPNPNLLEVVEGRAFWSSQRNLVAFTPETDETFSFPANQTRIEGLAGSRDSLVWSDGHRGRIFRLTR